MVIKTEKIADYELGLLYRDRAFDKVLAPGVYRFLRGNGKVEVVKIDLRATLAKEPALQALYLTHRAVVEAHFLVADMGDSELGVVYADGKLAGLVAPRSVAFYGKRLRSMSLEVIDAAKDIAVPERLVAPLARLAAQDLVSRNLVAVAEVVSDHVGLLYVDGVLEKTLTPGRYAFVKALRKIQVVTFDLRLQTLEVTGQEVLTKDRIGLRANVTAVYWVADPLKAVALTADLKDFLYKELQFALRQVIGTRSLEEVLGDKLGINQAVADLLLPKLGDAGLAVPSVGVKDIILPGDVRELMNRVIEAEKTAQANVIKRREETAATRSLLNTAKLMEDNPILLRLKELEALEKVSEKVGNVIVGNGMDGVLEDLVRIRPHEARKR
ncbi:slipin family protein [Pelagibius sp.]|uniref:slipin family protein n=1 Tax=Pelagibius sp. TaxID=1931238 RepID=UPI003BAFEAA1